MRTPAQANRYTPEPAILEVADFLADPVDPARFSAHILRWRNDRAAAEVGLNSYEDTAWADHFGRFVPLPGNLERPLALRYHGHQFGVYNPDIGDGRGFLYAQMRDASGRLMDLGTKGSGQTPYSRFGDGKLTLKGAVRELLATEMLEALGVQTSRSFSIIETGEELVRHDEPSPTRAAVLVRLNHSHIRIGSFQRLAALGDADALDRLSRYVLVRLFGQDTGSVAAMDAADAAAALMMDVVARTAHLAASYMAAGFVHGVLNTDNINVTGESFDYGPWRFAPTWDPGFVAAYFDSERRYAFGRQPAAIHWNCGQLALALRTICPAEPLIAALETFAAQYQRAVEDRMLWRLGYAPMGPASDAALVAAAEQLMIADQLPIDRFFFDWARGAVPEGADSESARRLAALLADYSPVADRSSPYFAAGEPCAMLIDEVEAIWAAIADGDDWTGLERKVAAVRTMGAALAVDSP